MQTLGQMDSMLSRQPEHSKGVFALPVSNSYRPANVASFPRSSHHPLAMTSSPMPTSQYAVMWPPTPPNHECLPIGGQDCPYSLAEDAAGIRTTASPWEEHSGRGALEIAHSDASRVASSGIDLPSPQHHFGNEWRLVSSAHDDGSCGNENQFLPFAAARRGALEVDTNIDYHNLPDDLSSAEPVTASTASFFGDADGAYQSPPFISAVNTPLSPVRSARSGTHGSASPSGPYRVSPYPTTSSYIEKRRSAPGNLSLDPQLQVQPHSHHPSPVHHAHAHAHHARAHAHGHAHAHAHGHGHAHVHAHPHASPPTSYLPSESAACSQPMGAFGAYEPQHDLRGLFYMQPQDHAEDAYTEFAERPNLYACLLEDAVPPPEEDMHPDDPDMVPHEQDLRFAGDLYTSRWVRGHGNKREGWCGICKPGRWLVLKNSAFWYDKLFTHGISAATGQQFVEPERMRQMDGNPDVWEGHCHSCKDWVPLVSSKKKGTTWFRHAYKCHTYTKVRDAPKRRRESHGKASKDKCLPSC